MIAPCRKQEVNPIDKRVGAVFIGLASSYLMCNLAKLASSKEMNKTQHWKLTNWIFSRKSDWKLTKLGINLAFLLMLTVCFCKQWAEIYNAYYRVRTRVLDKDSGKWTIDKNQEESEQLKLTDHWGKVVAIYIIFILSFIDTSLLIPLIMEKWRE